MKERIAALLAVCLLLTSCAAGGGGTGGGKTERAERRTKDYLTLVENEPDTLDPQCTVGHYTAVMNIFDRLVELRASEDGTVGLAPSLAESWEASEDGTAYHFRLRHDVKFSNGRALTVSDVRYTLERLLTYPFSCHRDIALGIKGAEELAAGNAAELAGFVEDGEYDFSIELSEPNEAFLASLASPAASILDGGTTENAGMMFGRAARHTVGTGPFILESWEGGDSIRLAAYEGCWSGAPRCEGVLIRFIPDADQQSLMFKAGDLDVLDLEKLGSEAEYYIRDEAYQDCLYSARHIGISYIAFNESVAPLGDVRVRRAMQLALDREVLLQAALSGRGTVENGIMPPGLLGYNTQLAVIPFDADEARRLLAAAGLPDGFELTLSLPASADENVRETAEIAVAMWRQIGVRVTIERLEEKAFRESLTAGRLACYYGEKDAAYNDPNDFLYPLFGTEELSRANSVCYTDESVMRRVRDARGIADKTERLREYRDLERRLVQEDAVWIPLFSRQHYYVASKRVENLRIPWNGCFGSCCRDISLKR